MSITRHDFDYNKRQSLLFVLFSLELWDLSWRVVRVSDIVGRCLTLSNQEFPGLVVLSFIILKFLHWNALWSSGYYRRLFFNFLQSSYSFRLCLCWCCWYCWPLLYNLFCYQEFHHFISLVFLEMYSFWFDLLCWGCWYCCPLLFNVFL